jgi:DNA-binding PadR family transcriptional regulator
MGIIEVRYRGRIARLVQGVPPRLAEISRRTCDRFSRPILGADIGIRYDTMKELLRGAVFLHILHHASEEPVHGAWMSEELARHGYKVSPGTLYPTLHRMEVDGLLVSEKHIVSGRVLRVYRTTSAGELALAEGRHAVRELANEVLPHRQAGGRNDTH